MKKSANLMNVKSNNSFSKSWIFFGLTFIYSWFFWGIAIILDQEWTEFPTIIFYILGGIGPSLIGVLLVSLTYVAEKRQEFWNRVFNLKRTSPIWYGVIIFFKINKRIDKCPIRKFLVNLDL